MCGETFSSKYTPEEKRAAAKAHPLQRPGRWSVVYTDDWATREDPRHFDEHKTAYFDHEYANVAYSPHASRNGYATKAEAEAALRRFQPRSAYFGQTDRDYGNGWFILPPLEEAGDHRIRLGLASGAVTQDDLADFVDAVLNNRQAQFEPLRERLAEASLVDPAQAAPKLTRAEAAQALIKALVPTGLDSAERWLGEDFRPGPGNAVTRDDFSDNDDEQDGDLVYDEDGDDTGDRLYYSFDPDQSRAIHAAVRAWFEADADAPADDAPAAPAAVWRKPEEERWGLFAVDNLGGHKAGELFHGYSTELTTREQAEEAQRKYGGRVARIRRDSDATDGWVEAK